MATLRHLMWTPPFPWNELNRVEGVDGLTVHWLFAVPIADTERQFLEDHGFDALEALLEEHNVEYFDLARSPVV